MKKSITKKMKWHVNLKAVLLLFCLSSLYVTTLYAAKLDLKPNNGTTVDPIWKSKFNSDAEMHTMRSQNMKHFRNASGTFTAFVASGSIHYLQSSEWLDIDNTIRVNNSGYYMDYMYANVTNNFKTYYPANPFKQPVIVNFNGKAYHEIIKSISFVDENNVLIATLPVTTDKVKAFISGNQITYKNIFNDIDVVYTQNNDGKKLDLVIKSNQFLKSVPVNTKKIVINEEVTFSDGIVAENSTDGIVLKNNGTVDVSFPQPIATETVLTGKDYVNDNELNTTGSMSYQNIKNGISVHTSFDMNWLNEPTRNFPVSLDPSANYGPFAISMATGYMTTATGAKTNGLLRLAAANTFAWAKFNLAALASVGALGVDSANYWGYHYSSTGTPDKLAKIAGMRGVDPVSSLNTAIVAQINSGPVYNTGYAFGSTIFGWHKGGLDTTLADTGIFNSISRGWFSLGMTYVSGTTTFMYQYGWNGASNICYLEVNYRTAPCTNPIAAGTITGNAVVCGGASTILGISGATIGTGMSYQWQSSPDSLSWTNVLGATSASYSPSITSDSIYFRCTLQCSAGTPANTPAYIVKADIFKVTALTPYNEGFESISANNQLPGCMSATNLGSITYTYLLPTGSYNQAARTGSKYGSFRYSCNDFFFSKGLKLTQGVNYSFSTWFVTDGYTGSWDSVSLYVATAPNSSSVTLLPGATLIQPSNTTYQQLMGSFTPAVTGVYNLAFKVKDAGIPWYLSIDDISVTESSAPVVASGTKTNITTNSVTLAGNIISNGGGTISASGVVVSTSSSPTRGGFGVTDSATNPLATSGVFTVNIAGLNLGTLYHYRAYAVNGVGTSYGADSTFTTNAAAVAPTVVKISATNLTAYAAKIGGNITSDGGSPVYLSGIVYATSSNPTLFGMGVVDSVTTPSVSSGIYYIYPVGLTPGTKYYYRAYAINAMGTAYSVQDSFLTSPVVATFPYFQNFDSVGNTGWSSAAVTGSLNDWAVGTPAKTTLTAAFSVPNAWITKLAASYSTSVDAALISPQFDFTALTANPILTFKHKFYTESCCDGGYLEISLDGGLTWTKVENSVGTGTNFNSTNGIGWYNLTTQGNSWGNLSSAYSTASNGWITSSIALPGTAGQSNVKFRFRFLSDTSVEYDGWEIDNVQVSAPIAPTVLTGTKTNITTSSVTVAGNITDNGNATITASGVVISTSSSPVRGGFGVIDSTTYPLASIGTFSVNVTGLMVATLYHYRAYAVNGIGTSYGADSTFTTNASAVAPTVVKNAATNVTTTTATIGGNITSDGGSPVFLSGVVYATTSNPVQFGIGVVDSMTNPVVSMGSFSIYPTGLLPGTKYYFKAYAINAMGTSYSTQDSFTTSPLVSTFPYFQNFDGAGNTGWSSVIVNGTINEWVVGTPAKVQLTAAYSAPKCWVTKLSGNYSDNQDAAVVSPQFDFSALTNDPVLSFRHNFITEAGWDAAVIEVSTNGGTNWKRVDSTLGTGTNFNSPNSYSWYNNTSTSGPMVPSKWSGNSNLLASNVSNWLLSQTRLTGMAGQSNVKIRIRFASDASGNDDGWAFDDVRVVALTTPTTQASAVTINTITATSMHVSWTNGNGSSRMVVAYPTSSIGVDPSNWKMYNSSTAFRSGDSTGTDNFVIYNGTGSTVTTTALTLFTNYTFNVYEYNGSLMHVIFNTPGTSNSATTLPVKLLSFTGSKMNEDVLLNWKTSTEINNSGFEIERSIDGSHFEFVKFVRGAGNSSTVKNYNAIDEKAFDLNNASVLYYRLKQIDVDGKFEYSKIITVRKSDISVKNNISVYPNPSNGLFNIGIVSATEGQATVIITDVKGQEISSSIVQLSKGLTTSQSDVLESVSNGIYFVKVIMNDEIIVTRISKVN